MKLYFLTGASGVGKTTLLKNLIKKYEGQSEYQFLHFDSIGVPSTEEMIEKHGSPEGWQEAMTHEWIDRILDEYAKKEIVVLEGQVNSHFIREGCGKHEVEDYTIVLMDCSEEDMCYRLTHERNQPELVSQDMKNWLKFLRKQGKELGLMILDTTALSEDEVVVAFMDGEWMNRVDVYGL